MQPNMSDKSAGTAIPMHSARSGKGCVRSVRPRQQHYSETVTRVGEAKTPGPSDEKRQRRGPYPATMSAGPCTDPSCAGAMRRGERPEECARCGEATRVSCDACQAAICAQCLKLMIRKNAAQACTPDQMTPAGQATAGGRHGAGQRPPRARTRIRNSSPGLSETSEDSLFELDAAVHAHLLPGGSGERRTLIKITHPEPNYRLDLPRPDIVQAVV